MVEARPKVVAIENGVNKILNGDVITATEDFTGISSGGGTHDIRIHTPADYKMHLKLYRFAVTAAPGTVALYEDATIGAAGSSITPRNMRRPTGDSGINTTVDADPTISDVGTTIAHNHIVGARKVGGILTNAKYEWILKKDTDYVIRYTNNSTSAADGSFVLWMQRV